MMAQLTEDDIALAGEHALGLLDPADRAAVAARVATDPDFAAEVEAWRVRLQPMMEGADEEPAPHLWHQIEKQLPTLAQDNSGRSLRWWKGASFVSTAVAAALAAVLVLEPAPPPPMAPAAPLVAALSGDEGNVAMTAQYDARDGQLLVTPVRLDTGPLMPELWVVPEDGKARSLGVMKAGQPMRVTVPVQLRPHLHRGVTLAITPEPAGGAPGGKATGPIIASGKIVSA
jgi:anti-sigma-K factor RskA